MIHLVDLGRPDLRKAMSKDTLILMRRQKKAPSICQAVLGESIARSPRCRAPHDFRQVGQLLPGAGWNGAHPRGSRQWPEQIGVFPTDARLPSARDGRNRNGEPTRTPGAPPDDQPCKGEVLEERTWLLSSHFGTSHQGWRGLDQATSSSASSSEWERDARGVASFTEAGSSSRESTARSSRQSRRS